MYPGESLRRRYSGEDVIFHKASLRLNTTVYLKDIPKTEE